MDGLSCDGRSVIGRYRLRNARLGAVILAIVSERCAILTAHTLQNRNVHRHWGSVPIKHFSQISLTNTVDRVFRACYHGREITDSYRNPSLTRKFG